MKKKTQKKMKPQEYREMLFNKFYNAQAGYKSKIDSKQLNKFKFSQTAPEEYKLKSMTEYPEFKSSSFA
jgi:hypothetical protein